MPTSEQFQTRWRWYDIAFAAMAIAFCLLRLPHLLADFPTASIFADDWSWYTDEGWYVSAGMNMHQLGHWVQPGDWSPGIAMPVWPAMASVLFHFTGVSVLALRRLGVVFSWLTVWLVYAVARRYATRTVALASCALVATSAILFLFSRTALLEEPMFAFTLLAMLLASSMRPGSYGKASLLGILVACMMLTKTTAVCLVPAVVYLVLPACNYLWRKAMPLAAVAGAAALALFEANQYLLAKRHSVELHDLWMHYGAGGSLPARLLLHSLLRFFYRGTWAGPIVFPLALAAVVAALLFADGPARQLLRNPLFASALLWSAGVAAFLVYHVYGPPRYFSLLTIPATLLCVLWADALHRRAHGGGQAVAALLAISAIINIAYIGYWQVRPEFSYDRAAQQIKQVVDGDPGHSHFVIGHGEAQLQLFTGLEGVDDAFGPATMQQRLAMYHPGWLVIWNDTAADDPAVAAAAQQYHLVPKGSFPAFHDLHRNRMLVFELEPLKVPALQ